MHKNDSIYYSYYYFFLTNLKFQVHDNMFVYFFYLLIFCLVIYYYEETRWNFVKSGVTRGPSCDTNIELSMQLKEQSKS